MAYLRCLELVLDSDRNYAKNFGAEGYFWELANGFWVPILAQQQWD
jgi:hypothetical protein